MIRKNSLKMLAFAFFLILLQGCNIDDESNAGEASDGAHDNQNPGWYMLFHANESSYGTEFWRSTGNPEDSFEVIDLNPGAPSGASGGSLASHIPVKLHSNKIIFIGQDGNSGWELFTTDGTLEGTSIVKDILPSSTSNPEWLTQLDEGRVLFSAKGSSASNARAGLWITDGTEQGTVLLTSDVKPTLITPMGDGRAVFRGEVKTAPESQFYKTVLMVTDGTAEGTRVVDDALPTKPQDINSLGDGRAVLFFFEDGVFGSEPWITDGTSQGTNIIKDIVPGAGHGLGSSPGFTAIADNTVLFRAGNITDGFNLWVTDTTADGTFKLDDANPFNITPLGNGAAIFEGRKSGIGNEPWVSDGTEQGTRLLKDIRSGAGGSDPSRFTVVSENQIFFVAADDSHGRELWFTDGTEQGTRMVKDIRAGSLSSNPIPRIVLPDGRLLFTANDGTGVGEIFWVTDGSEAGTEPFNVNESLRFTFYGNTTFFPISIDND